MLSCRAAITHYRDTSFIINSNKCPYTTMPAAVTISSFHMAQEVKQMTEHQFHRMLVLPSSCSIPGTVKDPGCVGDHWGHSWCCCRMLHLTVFPGGARQRLWNPSAFLPCLCLQKANAQKNSTCSSHSGNDSLKTGLSITYN